MTRRLNGAPLLASEKKDARSLRTRKSLWMALDKTEVAAARVLSLPMYPELQKEQVDYVCAMVEEFFGKKS